MRVDWKIGVEIELLAPIGSSRATLARELADRQQGSVRRVLHQDSEPSRVPGQPLFYNLTQGFEAVDARGRLIARCVDDLTLQADLERTAAPKPGWWRIVSDDERLLRLLALHTDPERDLPQAIDELAPLFQGELLAAPGGMYRLVDAVGAPLAIAAPLPGERERPCELITPPLHADHFSRIEQLLATARALGFVVPVEGATHIHFDATPLCSANTIANIVNLLETWGLCLRVLCGTPGTFRRVGGWPDALHACVNAQGFRALPWPDALARLRALGLTKYTDFNLRNIAFARADRHTFEARIFPASTDTAAAVAAAALMEAILRHCQRQAAIGPEPTRPWQPAAVLHWLQTLPLRADAACYWHARAAGPMPELPS